MAYVPRPARGALVHLHPETATAGAKRQQVTMRGFAVAVSVLCTAAALVALSPAGHGPERTDGV